MDEQHRKRIKHFHQAGDLHELTFSCYGRRPLLTNDLWRTDLAEAIDLSNSRNQFALLAYVFMPEHVHLLVAPLAKAVKVPLLLGGIKQPTSVKIKQRLMESNSRLVRELTVRQRPGVASFRFWQEGPGYDRNIDEPDDIQIVIDYIHENPVRRGLCRRAIDWKWSSARQLILGEPAVGPPALHKIDVESGLIEPL